MVREMALNKFYSAAYSQSISLTGDKTAIEMLGGRETGR